MARTILGDPERFIEKYWKVYEKQGWYLTGDSARIDEDGYFWIIGRNDDVLKVSGYRLGSAEIESALVSLFAESLPKTRSGKIMRRVLKARVLGQDEGDLTSLEE